LDQKLGRLKDNQENQGESQYFLGINWNPNEKPSPRLRKSQE